MCLHKQNIQLFFGTNNFQYNFHLSSFPVYIISNWLIHWVFHKFSSECCLIPHNLFCWLSLFTFPSFLYAGSLFKASVWKGSMLSLCIQSESSDPSPHYWYCLHSHREGEVFISLCYWIPVANALSEAGDESSCTWMCPHTHRHTQSPGPAEVSSSTAHGEYTRDPIAWNTPHAAISVRCSSQVATICTLRYKAWNFCRHRAKLSLKCPHMSSRAHCNRGVQFLAVATPTLSWPHSQEFPGKSDSLI